MFFYSIRLYGYFNFLVRNTARDLKALQNLTSDFRREYAWAAKQAGIPPIEAATALLLLLVVLECPEERHDEAIEIIQGHAMHSDLSIERVKRMIDRGRILMRHGRLPFPYKTRQEG